MVTETATSDVVIISIGVLYRSKTSKTERRKPKANNILPDFILMAVIPSFAATAVNRSSLASAPIKVPTASGCMVLSKRTFTFLFCAGSTQVGCKILAPK